MRPPAFPFLVPFAVIAVVVTIMLGLGSLFTVAGETGTIAIGLAIIVVALAAGFVLTRETGGAQGRRFMPRANVGQLLRSPVTIGLLLFKVEPAPAGARLPLRLQLHRLLTEGPGGLLRLALLDLLLAAGEGMVYGADIANGVLERGYGFNTWMGFALGFTFVCVVNAALYLIALDYREERFRREELPLIWHKD